MKKLLLICFFIFNISYGYAQHKKIDSLKNALKNVKSNQAAILITAKLAHSYLYYKPDTDYLLAQSGLRQAKKIGFLEGQARCMKESGEALQQMGNYPGALAAYLKHLQIAQQLNIPYEIGQALINISLIYIDQEEYRPAINYTLKAKNVLETLPGKLRTADYELTRNAVLLNAGFLYYKINKLDSALIYEQNAYELGMKIHADDYMGNILLNLGSIQQSYHNRGLALTYFRMSTQKSKTIGDSTTLTSTYLKLSDYYRASNHIDSGIYYAKQALATAKAALYTKGVMQANNVLADSYATVNQGLAYMYLKSAVAAKDSLFSQEKIKELQNLKYEEKTREQELAELKLQQEEERKNYLQLSAIALFIPVFFLIVLLLSKTKLHYKVIEFLSVLTILFLFEFITLLLHPIIQHLTHDTLILDFFIFVGMAGIITPMHHRFTHWLKERLAHTHKWGEKHATASPARENVNSE